MMKLRKIENSINETNKQFNTALMIEEYNDIIVIKNEFRYIKGDALAFFLSQFNEEELKCLQIDAQDVYPIIVINKDDIENNDEQEFYDPLQEMGVGEWELSFYEKDIL